MIRAQFSDVRRWLTRSTPTLKGMSEEQAVPRPRGSDMQSKPVTTDHHRTVLIIGISRGIGRGLAAEYLRRGWSVIGTVRSPTAAPGLEEASAGTAGRLRVERLDMTRPLEIGTLRERLAGERLDVLLVNAGISDDNVPIAEIDEATSNKGMST